MTTIVNTPPTTNGETNGNNMSGIVMFVVALGALLLIVYMLVPVVRRSFSAPSVTIPDKVDVNINAPKQ